MKITVLDLIYIIIMFQLLIFSVFLFIRKAGNISNYILGIQLISQAGGIFLGFCYAQSEFFFSAPSLFLLGFPFPFLWGPTFYLYVKSAAYSDFRLRYSQLLHFLPFIVVTIYLLITYFPLSSNEKLQILQSRDYFLLRYAHTFDYFIRIQVLVYIIFSLYTLKSVKEKLKEKFSSISRTNYAWVKFIVAGFTAAYVLSIPFIIYWKIFQQGAQIVNFVSLLIYSIYFNIIFFKAWYQPEIFAGVEENVKYKSSKLTKEEAEGFIDKLKSFIETKKPFLNPDLSLNQLSESTQIPARILSQIINENYNQNFQDFINRLRVEESKKYLIDNSNKKTILEILYEVGFNTKSAFNIAFKKTTGITPTEFRKSFSHQNESKTNNIIF